MIKGFELNRTGTRVSELLDRQYIVPTLDNAPTSNTTQWQDGEYLTTFRIGELCRVKENGEWIFYRLYDITSDGAVWQKTTHSQINSEEWFTLDKENGILKTVWNLVSEKSISAKGVSASGGGSSEGSANTLYQLLDVLKDSSIDKVSGAEEGNILTFNNGLWKGLPPRDDSEGDVNNEYVDAAIQSVREYIDSLIYLDNGVLFTDYPFASHKSISAKGIGNSSDSTVNYDRLDSWDGYNSSKDGYVLSAKLGYDLKEQIENLDFSDIELNNYYTKEEVNALISPIKEDVDNHKEILKHLSVKDGVLWSDISFASEKSVSAKGLGTSGSGGGSGVDLLMSWPTSWDSEFNSYALGAGLGWELKEAIENIDIPEIDVINSQLTELGEKVDGYDLRISSNESKIRDFTDKIATIEKWFVLDEEKGILKTTWNLVSDLSVSAKGIGTNSGNGGGSGVDILDNWENYDDSTKMYALSAKLGAGLRSDIQSNTANINTLSGEVSLLGDRFGDIEVGYEGLNGKVVEIEKNYTDIKGKVDDLTTWFKIDEDGNVYTTFNFYSTKALSAKGVGGNGTGSGGSVDILDNWENYNDNTKMYALSAKLGAEMRSMVLSNQSDILLLTSKYNTIEEVLGSVGTGYEGLDTRLSVVENEQKYVKENIQKFNEWFKVDKDGNIYTPFNFYSLYSISAKGVGTGGSSEGGANTLYQLWDVLKDENTDKVAGAIEGNVLTYNGTHWVGTKLEIPNVDLADINSSIASLQASNEYLLSETNKISGLQATVEELSEDVATNSGNIEKLLPILNWFTLKDGVLTTEHNLVSKKSVSAKGIGTNGETGSASALYQLNDVRSDGYKVQGAVKGSVLTYDGTHWAGAEIVIPEVNFDEVNSRIDTLEDSVEGNTQQITTLSNQFNNFLQGESVKDTIDKWVELEGFLQGFKDSDDLAEILKNKVGKEEYDETIASIEGTLKSHDTRITTNKNATESNATAIQGILDTLADWFTLDGDVLRTKYNLVSDKAVSAKGIGTSGSGSGVSYDRLDTWEGYSADKAGYVLSAKLGWDLKTQIENLDLGDFDLSGYYTAIEVNQLLTGKQDVISDLADIRSGATLGATALQEHQTIYDLTIKGSNGTSILSYTPNSKDAELTLSKSHVGLGNVDNLAAKDYFTALSSGTTNAVSITVGGTTKNITAATLKSSLSLGNVENTKLSTWEGTSKITTVGTITTGTWNGTKITNAYLANSKITIAGNDVSLGGSVSADTLKTSLDIVTLSGAQTISGTKTFSAKTVFTGAIAYGGGSYGFGTNGAATVGVLSVGSTSTFNDKLTITKNGMSVTGAAYFGGGTTYYFGSTGNVSANTLTAAGAATLKSTLSVSGASTLTGLLTANGGITVPSTKTIKIGDGTISWDSTNNAFKFSHSVYSLGAMSAKGIGSSSGTGGGVDVDWLNFPSSIVPLNSTYNLGSDDKPWEKLYVKDIKSSKDDLNLNASGYIRMVTDVVFGNTDNYSIGNTGTAYLGNIYSNGNIVATLGDVDAMVTPLSQTLSGVQGDIAMLKTSNTNLGYEIDGIKSGLSQSYYTKTEVDDTYLKQSTFNNSVAGKITSTSVTNWNTAYGWGNHAGEGYAKAVNVVDLSSQQTITGTKYFDAVYFNSIPFVDAGSVSVKLATMNDVPSITPLSDSGIEIARIDIGTQKVFLYANVDLSNYYTKTDIDDKGYATQTSVNNSLGSLSAEISAVDARIDALGTAASKNWSGASTTDTTNLVTIGWVESKLGGYATAASIPTKTSQLTNDSNFLSGSIETTVIGGGVGLVTGGAVYSFVEDSLSGYAKKATTLSGYGITDAYTKTQVDSALSGYLPLCGGTIRATNQVLLALNSSHDGGTTRISFFNKDVSWGYLGFNGLNSPCFISKGGVIYPLIHSGNYSSILGSVYAPKAITDNLTNTSVGLTDGYINTFMCDTINGYSPIHSGNIGSQSVAGATLAQKLTYRSIFPFTSAKSTYQRFARITLSAQYTGKVAVFKIFNVRDTISSHSGTSFEVYVHAYQQNALGSIPAYKISTNNDDRYHQVYGILNYDSTGCTLDVYLFGGGIIYRRAGVTLISGDADVLSIGDMVDELPSGTLITPQKMGTSYSATKLSTPRTIWGQSFDGSGDVKGSASFYPSIIIGRGESLLEHTYLKIQVDDVAARYYGYDKDDGYMTHRFYSNESLSFQTGGSGLKSIFFGNVLIGTTTDTDRAKLQVNGGIALNNIEFFPSSSATHGGYMDFHYQGSTDDYTSRIIEDSSSSLCFYANYDRFSGAVTIGSTSNLANTNSVKLYVNGNSYVNGELSTTGNILPTSNATYTLGSANYRWSKLYTNGIDCTGGISSTTDITALGNVNAINGGLSGKTLSVSGAASVGSLTVNGVAITGNGGFNGGTVSGETIFGSVGSNYMDTYQVYIGGALGALGVEGLIDAWGGVAGNGWEIMDTGDAYFQSIDQASDYNLKSILKDVRLSLGTMANAPLVQFDWNNRNDGKHHVGTIAQYWEGCLPEVVSRTKGGTLALGYGELGVAMGISLAKEMTDMLTRVDNTETEVDKLKKRISELEKEIETLKAA